jgi:hypothetical protein
VKPLTFVPFDRLSFESEPEGSSLRVEDRALSKAERLSPKGRGDVGKSQPIEGEELQQLFPRSHVVTVKE